MRLPKDIILEDGTLNEQRILKRESLYKGMNGRFVERFYLNPDQSYIFKPLTNNEQIGKEVWVHDHILSNFPAIFPKIIASSNHHHPETSWMILEDLGALSHMFDKESVLGVTRYMAWWHSLPSENYKDMELQGLKPPIEEITGEVLANREYFFEMLPFLGLDAESVHYIFTLLSSFIFSKRQVLSHGDLHLGNFAIAGDRIIVLDWEHTHLNVPYWDLYHMIDLSHPTFPKQMSKSLRELILDLYLEQVEWEVDSQTFKQEYYLFSVAFSFWMILLINKDLQAKEAKWSKRQLETQLSETIENLRQCTEILFDTKS
ncbi:phosphotransferase family protein [Neobacillus sp. LXY-1]|uniref:phosphotransferase family protein n=1 Tax=Neobacillus sp. LXY-1 TaxID=3379133 RepID=UPI003EDE90E2